MILPERRRGGVGQMGEGERKIQASNYGMSKSQKLKAQHKEDSQ